MSTEIPTDILAFVAEVEALVNDATPGPWTDDNGYRVRREDGEVVAETKHCEGSNSYDSTFIASARADVPKLIAIVRKQAARIATLEAPDGENLYEGCLCGEISPEDKPCLTCAARLAQWDSIVAERDALREKVTNTEAENSRYWSHAIECQAERDALRERIAKLEALGPWIEANRLAELDRAKTWEDAGCARDEAYVRGREDAFKQVGYELNNRAGKDLRKEPTES